MKMLHFHVLWSIRKQRNNKIKNDVINAQSFVVERAKSLLFDWKAAQEVSHVRIRGM